MNCTRQWGKSTVTAAKVVHRAWTQSGVTVLVVSPSARQSGEFMQKVMGFLRMLGEAPKGDGNNRLSVKLRNGSRIVGLPGTEATVRGFSAVSLVVVDEAARVREEMFVAMRPMLAVSKGGVVAAINAGGAERVFLGSVDIWG